MKPIRGLEVEEVGCKDPKLNVFYGKSGDFEFITRQPRKKDSRNHRRAWYDISKRSLREYMRRYVDAYFYDSKYRCNLPLYRRGIPGFLPLIMEVDDKIVGFADMMFKEGKEFKLHNIPEGDVGCSMNLCILDKHQGLGVGSFYGEVSVYIAEHFSADWALGYTRIKGGMHNIRMRTGWEVVSLNKYSGYSVIRKRL